MTTPEMWIDMSPYWLKPDGVKKIEELKQAKYMGYWCTKAPAGYWNEQPVDVFYVANPDTSKGHTNYFGLFYRDETLFITDGSSAFPAEGMTGMYCPDGEVIVSRYRHDFIQRKGQMIDGGRDYVRSTAPSRPVKVTVDGSKFNFEHVKFESGTE